jgi:hypothetical protein
MSIVLDFRYNENFHDHPNETYLALAKEKIGPLILKRLSKLGYTDDRFLVSIVTDEHHCYLCGQSLFSAMLFIQLPEEERRFSS